MTAIDNACDICRNGVDEIVVLTSKVLDKGKKRAQIFALENKMAKAQRQLGALVYSLHKSQRSNAALVDRYIANIEQIENQIMLLTGIKAAQTENINVKVCPACGVTVDKDAVFCNGCGAQL